MQNAVIRFCGLPNLQVTIDKEMASRGVAERLAMPWFVVRQYETIWATNVQVWMILKNRDEAIKATIVTRVPIVSSCPLVMYSCQVFVDESDKDDIKVTLASPMVPQQFQTICPHQRSNRPFQLCSCLVARLFDMASDDEVHNKEDADIALGVFRSLSYSMESIKDPKTQMHPYTNWSQRHVLFPYNMLYRIPMLTQRSGLSEPSKLLSAYFDFTLFCQTYEQVELYFSLCRYMHPARARLFMNNTKVANTVLTRIQDAPLRAFVAQLIEVEGLRQAAIDADSGEVKKLHVFTDVELQSAARVHEDLLCDSLLCGTADVQLYADSTELKLLTWMGGILVDHGKSVGRLSLAATADSDCVARFQQIASHWMPHKLLPANSLAQQLQNTNLLFVNTRGTVGRASPFIKKEVGFYRTHGLVTMSPADVTALEDRFDDLCRSMERLYDSKTRDPVLPVVTIVDLHLFSPLMLRTVMTFLLECQHGFKYNDLISPKTYRATRTRLPFKLLFLGDFVAHPLRGGTRVANEFLDMGGNRDCFYRDCLQDVYVNDDHYAKHVQLGLPLELADLEQQVVNREGDKPTLFRVYVGSHKTRLYRSTMPLPQEAENDTQYIGQEMGPTAILLPFSSVHLATTNPKHVYTALSMTAGDVVLHVPEAEMAKLVAK